MIATDRPPHPFEFFDKLKWLNGQPLMDTIEPYRREILSTALYTWDGDRPKYNFVLCGRSKKNWKTADLCLASLYRFLCWSSDKGNDGFILANDEQQAGDDLSLLKKIITANPVLGSEVRVAQKEIERKDGKGVLKVLPSRDVAGAHGKTFLFAGFDEIHAYRSHDLFEALAPDPSRPDALIWVTSYAGIRHAPGIPLYDLMQAGKRGDDDRLFFSWYAGDFTTDFARADAEPLHRANPSMDSWGNAGYLDQQRKRLPTHKFRRLHLNLPGAPDGAAFDGDKVMAAIVPGRKRLPPEPGRRYYGFVDMSGGSSDFAVCGITTIDQAMGRAVLCSLISQTGPVPFNPRHAVKKFAAELRAFGISKITSDSYAGEVFRRDFADEGISSLTAPPKSELYEALEPKLNAGEVELLDIPELQEQLLTLIVRPSGKIDHQNGDHDDFANAAAGAIWLASSRRRPMVISDEALALSRKKPGGGMIFWGPEWRSPH